MVALPFRSVSGWSFTNLKDAGAPMERRSWYKVIVQRT
jgi:hypothetical protein